MTIEELNDSIRLYRDEHGLKYGCTSECDPGADITEENWLSIVKFTNGIGADGFGIPCDPPMTWNDLKLFMGESIKINNDKIIDSVRIKNFPSVAEQLDDLYHQGLFSPEMTARIRAVKEKYPKL
tara:strand:- start:463 stop:837 length:375 start_codon:yes stop_codon:yes gene_type:complete